MRILQNRIVHIHDLSSKYRLLSYLKLYLVSQFISGEKPDQCQLAEEEFVCRVAKVSVFFLDTFHNLRVELSSSSLNNATKHF